MRGSPEDEWNSFHLLNFSSTESDEPETPIQGYAGVFGFIY